MHGDNMSKIIWKNGKWIAKESILSDSQGSLIPLEPISIQETTDPIPDFPTVNITDSFFAEISELIPAAAPTSTQEEAHGIELTFRNLLKAVKKQYPTDCSTKNQWVLTTWLILVDYSNTIWDSEPAGTEYRKLVIGGLVDRFQQAFQNLRAGIANDEVIK